MSTSGDDELIHFNGINALTGEPLFPPMTATELAKAALAEVVEPNKLAEIEALVELRSQANFSPTGLTDARELSEVGWGVLFAHDEDPQVREALRPLLDHRRQQTGDRLYYEYSAAKGWRPGEDKFAFLKRHEIFLQGQVDPEKAPYYLLIVGSPEKIPYPFQFDMDVEFAVGRLHFDTPEEYARYARSVVEAESGRAARAPTATFFGALNENDPSTPVSVEHLIKPLAAFAGERARKGSPAWEVRSYIEAEANKPRLRQILGGPETPALLLTASHGMGVSKGTANQIEQQGALLCSEWVRGTPCEPEHYFAAADLADDADVRGMIAVLFACFGAGTPRTGMFRKSPDVPATELAPSNFVANLPRRMLAHPRGGALAVVGHVDTAMEKSFTWGRTGPTLLAEYKSLVGLLMRGVPIGHAMDGFGARYGVLEVQMGRYRDDEKFGGKPKLADVTAVWMAKTDARAFVIIGDPAVRLDIRAPAA